MLAERLQGHGGLPALDCGDRPEDFTREIAEAGADTIVIVDAVEMGGRAGEVAVFDAIEVRDDASDTHRASLVALMRYLEMRTGAEVRLLGIQPAGLADTPVLSQAVAVVLDVLEEWFVAASHVHETSRAERRPVPAPVADTSDLRGRGSIRERS